MDINIQRLVDNINKTSIYTPLVEAIVNSMHAIEESGREDGEITVVIKRNKQKAFDLDDGGLSCISDIEISDNGIGFNDDNKGSFNKIYSERKIEKGGKGFGRFTFLKYFEKVSVSSIYENNEGSFSRDFDFVIDDEIIKNEVTKKIEKQENKTTVSLRGLRKEHEYKLERKIETIARKLLEKLLVYFAIDDYLCPRIVIKEDGGSGAIVLNDYFEKNNEISKIESSEFDLQTPDLKEKQRFKIKVFKVFYGESRSSINLVADNRQVTDEALHNYVPEFKDDFYEDIFSEKGEKTSKNYKIKTYVLGDYLDKHVSLERSEFEFQHNKDLIYPFSQQDIEREAARITQDVFKGEILPRRNKKEKRVKDYVDSKAPWHKIYVKDLDLASLPFDIDEPGIESELQKIKFRKEQGAKRQMEKILQGENGDVFAKVDSIIGEITEIGKSDLIHYVALRRVVLDLFKESLSWNEEKKYEKEKVVHDIIFPTTGDSDNTPYEEHNLWIIDERLSFHEYLSSDKPLNSKDERPDILIFDNKISVRSGDELSNPIIVFEFKRPQREGYSADEDPIKQIGGYVKKIRNGNFTNPQGRTISANEDTPAFGYLICDLSQKIKEFCEDHSLTLSPDHTGYFGYHTGYKMYMEVINFDKLVKDAELRNKIFFKKLGLE